MGRHRYSRNVFVSSSAFLSCICIVLLLMRWIVQERTALNVVLFHSGSLRGVFKLLSPNLYTFKDSENRIQGIDFWAPYTFTNTSSDSLFLGIDSSGGINTAVEFTQRRNWFLKDVKSISVSKIEGGYMGNRRLYTKGPFKNWASVMLLLLFPDLLGNKLNIKLYFDVRDWIKYEDR